MYRYLFIFFALFFSSIAISQTCPPGGALFVNEVYNANSSAIEYMELVVLGDPAAPTDPVNLEGWMIDDNNIQIAGQGNASGHLILDANFSSVNPGAIILIYNESQPYGSLPASNPPWLYVVAGSDLDGCSQSPSVSPPNPTYAPCGTPGGSWNYTQLNNTNDVVQTRNPSASFYHGVVWGGASTTESMVTIGNQTASLDCGDWFDPSNYDISLAETPGDFNTPLNEELIMDIRNGNLDCNDIAASCLPFVCPDIGMIDFIDEICLNSSFSITATGLASMDESSNTETDFGINFVVFDGATAPPDPYTGGTSIGIVPNNSLTGVDPNQSASINTSFAVAGDYTICAILDPPSFEADCIPSQCKSITINDNPEASLSGYQLFCPGDCHEINTAISGGEAPYNVSFLVQVGPINFPFNIPSLDLNNNLIICYDSPGFIPDYDIPSNTLHFPTLITGSGTMVLQSVSDANGCITTVISPNFTTLEFSDAPSINPVEPLSICDEDGDGFGTFDLESLNSSLNGGNGLPINWYEDPDGNIPISDPSNFLTGANFVYANVVGSNCNSEIIAVELILVESPDPGNDITIEICSGDPASYNILDLIGGEIGGSWFDIDNSGINLTNPSNIDFSILEEGVYQYSYTIIGNGICPDVSAILTIDVQNPESAGEDGILGICIGSETLINLFDHIGDDYSSAGLWSDPFGSGIDVSNPFQVNFSSLPIGTYQYYYTVTSINACADQMSILNIEVYAEPNAGNSNTVNICNSGETRLDLEDALGPHDNIGFWTDIDNSGVDLFPPSDVDFIGIDTGIYHYQYTIPETDNCPEVTSIITVVVLGTLSAGIDGTISICSNSQDTINLFELIIGESNENGFWTQTGGDPVDISDPNSVLFIDSQVGIDTFLYQIQNECGIDSSLALINKLDGPNAGRDYLLNICGATDTINLFDSLISYDGGGTWFTSEFDTLNNPTEQVFETIDTFSFFHIIADTIGCGSDTANAVIQILPSVYAGKDTSLFICEGSEDIINLYDLLQTPEDTSALWIQLSGNNLDLSKPDSLDLKNESIGIDSLIFILNGPCNADTALVVLNIDNAPFAGQDYNLAICENYGTINLFDSLNNYSPGGSWYDQNLLLIQTPDQFLVPDPGTYLLSYILPASGSCQADTASAEIIVESAPNAGIDNTVILCEGIPTSLNLFEQLLGQADSDGTWYEISGSGIDLDNWQSVDFSSVPGGGYYFIYVINPEGGFNTCAPDTANLHVSIVSAPNPGSDNYMALCSNEANLFVNLDSLLLIHDTGGDWYDNENSGVDLNSPNQIDLSSLDPGIYTYTYRIDATSTCPQVDATISIELFEAPYAGSDQTYNYCEGYDQTINLFGLLDADVLLLGDWEDPEQNNLDLTTPDNFDLSQLLPGTYPIDYIISLNTFCGYDTARMNLIIEQTYKTGFCDTLYLCNGPSEDHLNLPTHLSGNDSGGFFRELTDSGVDISDPTNIDFEGIVEGSYIFEYYFPAHNSCPEVSSRIYIHVLPSDQIIFEADICQGESFTIGNTIYDLTNPTGIEYLVNQEGCDSIINVNLSPRIITFETSAVDANCFGFGSISIDLINGSSTPVWLSNDDIGIIEIQSIPYEVNNISPGDYDIQLTDDRGCIYNTLLSIEPFPGFQLELSDLLTLSVGESFEMDLFTDMDPISIIWWPESYLDCYDCLNPITTPSTDIDYTVTLTNDEGCSIMDSISIRIKYDYDIFVPNVFSPNNDELNQTFFVKSNSDAGSYNLSIYSRWGEKVFYETGLPLNDPNSGWNGQFKGKSLNPGVYVYFIELYLNNSDDIVRKSGDILLLK